MPEIDHAFIELQRQTEHLEFCGKDCSYEHKRDQPELHKRAVCLVCGIHQPSGHVLLNSPAGGRPIARVCSHHSLWELIGLPHDINIQLTLVSS